MSQNQTIDPAAVDPSASFPFKAVIFDMDGTLIDSTEADYLAWKKVFEDYGEDLTFERYFPLLGMKSMVVVHSQLGITDQKEVIRILLDKQRYFEEIVAVNPIQAITGAEKVLKTLRKYPVKIGLATSSRRPKMTLALQRLDFIRYFDTTVTGEEINNSKPAPDIYIEAARRLNVRAEDCVVVEDAVSGVRSAKNAHMKCIAITNTHPAEMLHEADIIINSFTGIDFKAICSEI